MSHNRFCFGMRSPSTETRIDVSAASQQIVGISPNRYALVLGAPLAGTITYSTEPIAAAGNGFTIAAGQDAMTINAESHGNVTQRPWFAFADAANRLAAVIEVMLPVDERSDRHAPR